MIADYPDAIWIPAHPTRYRPAGRMGFRRIVIHCTDGRGDPRATAEMWQTDDTPHSSAHFVVGQDGTVVQCVRLTDIAFHAHQANADSIGVEHCARKRGELGPNDPGLAPTQTQLEASARLVAWLLSLRGLEPTREVINGHGEVDPQTTHADCPDSINLDAYVGLVAAVASLPKEAP